MDPKTLAVECAAAHISCRHAVSISGNVVQSILPCPSKGSLENTSVSISFWICDVADLRYCLFSHSSHARKQVYLLGSRNFTGIIYMVLVWRKPDGFIC